MTVKIDGSIGIILPPIHGEVVGTTTAQSISNKTINLSTNTIIATLAQLNSSIVDAELVDLGSFDSHKSDINNPHSVTAAQVGLGNVNNTSDSTKIVLSASKLTTARTIAGTSFDGQANIDISYNNLTNKPALGTASSKDVPSTGNASTSQVVLGSDTRLNDARTPTAHTHAWSTITGTPTTLSGYGITDAVSSTGTAASATKLATARTINGVSFDGTSNITINAADSTARIASSEKGVANGVATLGADGKVPSAQLPSFVDDVLEYTNFAGFPTTGEIGKIYVALDTNKTYRWSGSAYVYITSGAVDSVAGKTGVVTLTKSDVGLSNVDNTADSTKSVLSASKLTTARTIAGTSFDGQANIDISYNNLTNRPTLGTAAAKDVPSTGNASTSQVVMGNDTRLSDARTPTLHSHVISDVTNLQTALDAKQPLDSDLSAIAALVGNSGLLKKTAANTWDLDTNAYLTSNQTISVSGDASGTGTTSITLTLVNTGVGAGTYNNSATSVRPFTVDAKGRVTDIGTAVTITPAFSSITGKPTTISGYGITDALVLGSTVGSSPGTASAGTATTAAKSDHVHPLQTTVSGNAGSATKLETARTINGVSFDGTANITINAVDSTARIASSEKGVANGVATLGADGKVPSTQLPSFVDDILEYTNFAGFPVTGETGKIYVALDTNKIYRWSGSAYIEISPVAGNADSATKLATARTIALSGDVTGSASFDGSANISITATVGDDTHAHAFTNITSKPTTLSGYGITDAAPSSHVGAIGTAHGDATTSVAGFMSAADKTKLNGIAANANNYSLPAATATTLGGVELASDTVQSVAANAVTSTAGRTYGIQVNTSGQLVANVPWTDTVYTHPTGDGNSHVPATGTTNNGKVLKAGSTANSAAWGSVAYSEVTGTPTLGTAAAKDVPATGNASTTQVVLGSDTRLSDARTPTAHNHAVGDVTGLQTALDAKQATLVSGTNIKTINGASVLGAGDIAIVGAIVGAKPSLQGDPAPYVTQTKTYQITNYNSFSTYSVAASAGTASISGDTITFTAPSTAGSVNLTLTVDSQATVFVITVQAAGVAKPTNTSPADGAVNIGASPTLASSAFGTVGATDTHASSRWRVYQGATLVHDSGWSTTAKTSYTVPAGVVEKSMTYTWTVEHQGTTLGNSQPSAATSFSTAASFGGDVGTAGSQGFGVGEYPGTLPSGFNAMTGTSDKASANYGNYTYSDGSVMVFVPKFYYRIGSNSSPRFATYGANAIDIANAGAFADEAAANAAGYALHRAFKDGGAVKSGFFIDKYLASKNGTTSCKSVQNGNPISLTTSATYNPSNGMTGCTGILADAVVLARARGAGVFNVASIFMYDAIAKLSLAHGQAATGTANCAWYDATGTTNFPKGCNTALKDTNDAAVTFTTAGVAGDNKPKTGSASNLAKTTHNGQSCGVTDVNGAMWQVMLGLTQAGTSATDTTQNTTGNAYVLKTSVALANLTGGFGGANDAWGTTSSLTTNFDLINGFLPWTSATGWDYFGNGSNQVFSGATSGTDYLRSCVGIANTTGMSASGTNQFGSDGNYRHGLANLFPIASGDWSGAAVAGVFCRYWYVIRSGDGNYNVGFRAAAYGN